MDVRPRILPSSACGCVRVASTAAPRLGHFGASQPRAPPWWHARFDRGRAGICPHFCARWCGTEEGFAGKSGCLGLCCSLAKFANEAEWACSCGGREGFCFSQALILEVGRLCRALCSRSCNADGGL